MIKINDISQVIQGQQDDMNEPTQSILQVESILQVIQGYQQMSIYYWIVVNNGQNVRTIGKSNGQNEFGSTIIHFCVV